ncbi:OmpA family protein [Vibrio mimicus]
MDKVMKVTIIKTIPLLVGLYSISVKAEVNYPIFFAGVELGHQIADDNNFDYSDPTSTSLGFTSGFQFDESWLWDIGYRNSDTLEAKETNIKINPQWVETALRYKIDLLDDIGMYSRFGVSYWSIEKTINDSNQLSANGISPLIELGISYSLTQNIDLTSSFKYIDQIGDKNTGQYDSSLFLLGLNYYFSDNSKKDYSLEEKTINNSENENNKEASVINNIYLDQDSMEIEHFPREFFSTYFAFASSVPNIKSRELNNTLKLLQKQPQRKVILTGNTDNIGSTEFNRKLGLKRAINVADYLIKNGVKRERITVLSNGETKPIGNNNTHEGRLNNLRVDIEIPSLSYKTSEKELISIE